MFMRRAATVRSRRNLRAENRLQIENCKLKIRVQGSGFRIQGSALGAHHSALKKHLSFFKPMSAICNLQFAIYNLRSLLCGWLVAAIIACFAATARGEVDLPEPNRSDPIAVNADAANRWTAGSYDVWLLKGNCRIQQGDFARDAARHCCGSSVPTARAAG